MGLIAALKGHKILLSPLLAWLCAQVLKVAFSFRKDSGFDFELLVGPGGMPSAHSALVTALATIAGLVHGWDSDAFAISFVLAMLTMYDAAGIRRSAGRQARILNQIMHEWHASKTFRDVRLRELLGHSPFEVFAGALLGIVTAILVHAS
ncbi:MAG: divergent PAP2 family protein [Bacillota bacterium]|nr:divergent PAP2 family protein [Bacillota bacterium]